MYKFSVIFCCVLGLSSLSAKSLTFSTGEWAPYISETMIGYGPAGQVMTEACKRLKLKCNFEFVPWKRAWTMAKKGVVPATFLWSYTDERSDEMFASVQKIGKSDNTVHYMRDQHPEGFPDIKTWSDIQKYRMVGVRGYYSAQMAEKHGVAVHKVNNSSLAWKFLAAGKADVFVENPLVAITESKSTLGDKASVVTKGNTLSSTGMHIFFSRIHSEGKELRNAFDQVLGLMHKEGFIEKTYNGN